jgi:hypothetical protein
MVEASKVKNIEDNQCSVCTHRGEHRNLCPYLVELKRSLTAQEGTGIAPFDDSFFERSVFDRDGCRHFSFRGKEAKGAYDGIWTID